MKILAVDDDASSRLLLRSVLEDRGHEVIEADGGPRAWEIYKASRPPLLIVDWMMPELNGPDLCRRIRSAEHSRYSYIILLTALTGRERAIEGLEAGADDFISKPFHTDELLARIHVASRIITMQERMQNLEGLLNMCSYCKRIREQDRSWVQVERYVTQRSEATFSHGICPDCFESHVQPELDELKKGRQR